MEQIPVCEDCRMTYDSIKQQICSEESKHTRLRWQREWRPQNRKIVPEKLRRSNFHVFHKSQRTKPWFRRIRTTLERSMVSTTQAQRRKTLGSGRGKTMGGGLVKQDGDANFCFKKLGTIYCGLKKIKLSNSMHKTMLWKACKYWDRLPMTAILERWVRL